MTLDLDALIAKAREEVGEAAPTGSVDIELGGELVEVVFRRLGGTDWADLTSTTPPLEGSKTDIAIGYGTDAVAAKYPAAFIVSVGGVKVTQEKWLEILDLILAPSRSRLAVCLFELNQALPARRLAELGKARRAAASKKKPNSPAN